MICLFKTFWKLQKLIPSKKDHSVLIAEIRPSKQNKNCQSMKVNSHKKILPHDSPSSIYFTIFFEIT